MPSRSLRRDHSTRRRRETMSIGRSLHQPSPAAQTRRAQCNAGTDPATFGIHGPAMDTAQATESPAASKVGAARSGGVLEWFWRGRALQEAKAAPKASTLRRERLRRARLAAELADRTIDPAEPLRDGSSVPLAITLFREAAYWALLAKSESEGKPSLRELIEAGNYPRPALSD